jgi:hypothetical protein
MYTDDQLRVAANLQESYEALIGVVRALRVLPKDVQWKTIRETDYLYVDGRSLGPRTDLNEEQFARDQQQRAQLRGLVRGYEFRLQTQAAFYKAAKLPLIDGDKARLFKALDEHQLLGTAVIVVGTLCLAAYEMEAQAKIDAPSTTLDVDISWMQKSDPGEPILWPALRALDDTFCVTEQNFTARNRKGIVLDLLSSAERVGSALREPLHPIVLPGQEWLLNGQFVEQIVCGVDRTPCRLVVPDPRWFALHKYWLSYQADRNPLKKAKDLAQAHAVWMALGNMPRFPIDDDFEAQVQNHAELNSAWKTLSKTQRS